MIHFTQPTSWLVESLNYNVCVFLYVFLLPPPPFIPQDSCHPYVLDILWTPNISQTLTPYKGLLGVLRLNDPKLWPKWGWWKYT